MLIDGRIHTEIKRPSGELSESPFPLDAEKIAYLKNMPL